ncbi:phosphate/phosphite/phosphonate ABC transporter substrate-binding protein [Lichenifustis flavocetrariae]|uniref:PhnD/SsuA/transferrin family substrate-binding protein n=1 Tax=Lichenifustis flavocetrariae TaxID=2949735 RepID=A0AA42CHL0_9HYPH|nr:PhnD/SsuA/transferrin family substrate-binding protein [Lichenifustis flavocetrariae]MCW6507653.1 PhnD/SsuA/transferrin family substrate-binding protein [Lichenifustis flavocetrariae]
MVKTVSWPMYAVDQAAVEAFWGVLRRRLEAAGLDGVPHALAVPTDLLAHWRRPDLLLSQTCGYPFVTALSGAVRYVATPRFRAPGCDGPLYRSAIVVRVEEPLTDLVELAGRRVAYNSTDSHSGYNSLRARVAPLAVKGRFFAAGIATGAHRNSLAAVRSNRADVAAIDAVTLSLIARAFPDEVAGLKVIAYTDPAPGLPFITAPEMPETDVAKLRQALAQACDPSEETAGNLLLDGIEILPPGAYDVIGAMQARAFALDYPQLI